MTEKALTAVIQGAYIQGISIRAANNLVQVMAGTGISPSQISRLGQEIDEWVHIFLERPTEGKLLYLWIDATYVKMSQDRRIVSVPVIVAVGARCWTSTSARRRLRPFGPSSWVSWPGATCARSSW